MNLLTPIRSVEYVTSLGNTTQTPPEDLPQVAFSGRSNVGKSSLINTLLNRTRRKIAHVSGQPGKTRTINFFRVNEVFYLVDLPGYGYAKVPLSIRDEWRALIEGYLGRASSGTPLRGMVHLIDIRRGPMELDLEMLEYLAELGLPTLVVLTKADKLGKQTRTRAVAETREALGLDASQMLTFSSKTGDGRDELVAALEDLLAEDPE